MNAGDTFLRTVAIDHAKYNFNILQSTDRIKFTMKLVTSVWVLGAVRAQLAEGRRDGLGFGHLEKNSLYARRSAIEVAAVSV